MINITINNKSISVEEGITIIEAAHRNRINIPSMCYLKDVNQLGACRICVVEVEGARTLQASCMVTVQEGMVIHTNTEQVRNARKVLYELMLSDHSEDCLHCVRNQNCDFQMMGKLLGVDSSRFEGEKSQYHVDASTSITRDMSKCILCRRCVSVCSNIQEAGVLFPQNRGFSTEITPAMNLPIGNMNCTMCGQCTVVCPVGALKETSSSNLIWKAISNPKTRTVVQVAPAVRVALGEEFGCEPGTRVTGKMAAALRRLGFDDVFDTNFAADLTIVEEGTELLTRIKTAFAGGKVTLPIITSCSPGWVKFMEHTYPDTLDHLSTCKSPHMKLGALAKSYYADKIQVEPKDMFVVSVMPCTAKKTEIARQEMKNNGLPNVDAVITTRELAEMIKSAGIDFTQLPDEGFDNPLGMSTGAADIFGLTGGVMEAALRTVYELITGRELPFDSLHITPIMGFEQIKEASIKIEGAVPEYDFLEDVTVRVAVTSGLAGARKLMDQVAAKDSPYHFIEIMGCPGGCIMGGGQPRSDDPEVQAKRLSGLYSEDENKELRKSHDNPFIKSLYDEFLGTPNGHKCHELLHTNYTQRGIFNELTNEAFVSESDKRLIQRQQKKTKRADTEVPVQKKLESPRILELEAENRRLKDELKDTMETVDILKKALS